jgi:hypothetical protein
MNEATGDRSRRTIGRVLGSAAATLLFAAAIIQPRMANAGHNGGGGTGFHGDGGGFHGGGVDHGSRHFHSGFAIAGSYAYGWGYGYPYSYYGYDGNYSEHGYYGYDPAASYYGYGPGASYYGSDPGASYYGNPAYGYGFQPKARQTWYYCSNPAGYYPYVTQCKTGWAPVPAS